MPFSIYDSKIITVYFLILAAALGLVMGSFLHCAAWRIVRGESFLKGRSRCPQCGHTLTPIELIPVFSWLIQKGRCRNCNSPIPVRYPLSELAFATLTVLTLLRFDLTIVCLRNFIFLCCLFCLTLTDLDDQIIPDECHIISIVAWGVCTVLDFPGWKETGLHIMAALVFWGAILGISLAMDHIMHRDTMGGGDIKLIAVAALYLGFAGTLFMLIIACIIGLLGAGFFRRMTEKNETEHGDEQSDEDIPEKAFPFGPALAASTYLMLLFGEPLIRWYMGLL